SVTTQTYALSLHDALPICLGRRDAVFQLVDKQAQSRPVSLRGRAAARFKASVLTGAAWSTTHPTSGLPSRRHRLAASSSPAESRSEEHTSELQSRENLVCR